MPPTFKKAKGYDPGQATKTLGSAAGNSKSSSDHTTGAGPDADDRQLLISLGLADAGDSELAGDSIVIASRVTESKPLLEVAHAAGSAYAALRERLEGATEALQAGQQLGDAARLEVQQLLCDQQHHIELLLRGQTSLKGSMNSLRRSSKEQQVKNTALQQLEAKHCAALKEMEGKLERAIQQVQQLQHSAQQRQQQQADSAQQSLQAAHQEAGQLAAKVEDLQAALAAKEQELLQARQQLQQQEEQVASEQATQEQQRSGYAKQLKDLSQHCQAAREESSSRAAALATANAGLQDLTEQLRAALAAQQRLEQRRQQLQAQLQEAQQRESERVLELEQRCKGLQSQLQEAQRQGSEHVQELNQRCQQLQGQLQAVQQQESERVQQLEVRCQELQAAQQQESGWVQELEQRCQKLSQQLDEATTLQGELAAQSAGLQQELAVASRSASSLPELEVRLQQAEAERAEAVLQHTTCSARCAELLQQKEALEEQATALQWKVAALQTELQKAQRASASTIQELRKAADSAQAHLADAQASADKRAAQAEAAAAREVELYKQRWRDEFERRRKLHNQVIELKGNIRVLARIRPMMEKEHTTGSSTEGGSIDVGVRVVDEETVALSGTSGRCQYEFDHVFGPADGQLQVYQEVSGVVTSILDGYNAAIMAYGQTSSGKTYTLEGPADDPGINSRALAELFQLAEERASELQYSLSASVVEIYNEQIYDLLAGSKDTGDKLDIKEGPSGMFIPNLRIEGVASAVDVAAVLQKGKQNRSTFATNMNEHSSRSHLILSIYCTARQLVKGTTWSSKLHLIDLAGSERVSRSGAEGDRLKEAAAINKSLSALGDVVAALQQRSSHVPYRNSKLTRLLEDSLGGSSKTLLVVNCSPAAENVGETKCSLEFATRARKVELGAATCAAARPSSELSLSSPGSPGSGRDSLMSGGKSSQGGAGASANGPGSTLSSPRLSGRHAGSTSELRQAASRRAAAIAPPQPKDERQ